MKRAARDIVGAGALERHVALDHVNDIDAVKQVLDERLRNQFSRIEDRGLRIGEHPIRIASRILMIVDSGASSSARGNDQ